MQLFNFGRLNRDCVSVLYCQWRFGCGIGTFSDVSQMPSKVSQHSECFIDNFMPQKNFCCIIQFRYSTLMKCGFLKYRTACLTT